MKLLIRHIVPLLLLSLPAAAQDWAIDSDFDSGWEINASTVLHTGAGPGYPGVRIGIEHVGHRFRFGMSSRLNENLNFTFAPGDLIIYVDDPAVSFQEGTRLTARPDRYSLGLPAETFAAVRFPFGELTGHISMLVQQAQAEVPEARRTEQELYVLNWESEQYRQMRLSAAGIARINYRSVSFMAGVLGIPLIRMGDSGFRYAYRPHVSPYIGLSLPLGSGSVGASTTSDLASFTYRRSLHASWLAPERGAAGRIAYHTGINGFPYHAVQVHVDLPIGQAIRGTAGVSHTWSGRYPLGPSDFAAWQSTVVPGAVSELSHGLPQTSLRLGLRIRLGGAARVSPLRFLAIELDQDRIFPAARSYYANHPIGSVLIRNTSRRSVSAQLRVKTTEASGNYKSAPFTLEPEAERRIPIFLYPTDVSEARHEQLVVIAEAGDGTSVEARTPLVTYGRNAWNGDTQHLRHFLTPEDPEIRRHARDHFVATLQEVEHAAPARMRFERLQRFLALLGQGLVYVEDPTTTSEVDHVQYPIETLRDGRGDCEDLTVFLATSLMAVGIGTAIVDVRPDVTSASTGSRSGARRGIGHVFLLVDTGISPADVHALGLNDFQVLTRPDAAGDPTLWIPIETSVLDKSFDDAFAEGVRQYVAIAFGTSAEREAAVRVIDL